MYLGGNHVRIVCVRECEELLKFVQRSRDSRLDLAGGLWLQAARMLHTCQTCQKLKCRASCCTTGQKSQASQAVCLRLNPVVRSSRQNTLFGKIWLFTFLLTLLYIYPFNHDLDRASRENFERETLEKTRLTHPQSLPKRLFKFLYSLPLHCQILERLITKTFFHHIHFCKRVVWCFGKQLGRNQFHIGWCYGQVVESKKLEKK